MEERKKRSLLVLLSCEDFINGPLSKCRLIRAPKRTATVPLKLNWVHLTAVFLSRQFVLFCKWNEYVVYLNRRIYSHEFHHRV